MAAYIRPLASVFGNYNGVTEDFIVPNATTVTNGDFVSFDGSGNVIPTTTGRIIGSAQSTVVGDGTKVVKVLMQPYVKYLVQANGTITAASVGKYYNLTGGTGVQLISTGSASTSNGQLLLLQVNPAIDPVRTDATWNVVSVAQSALNTENT
jgi:hypothetical protein